MFIKSKSKELKLRKNNGVDGAYNILIDNIGLRPETMKKCVIITKHFTKGNEFFFGFFRTDGFNLTNEQFQRYDKEIPDYLSENGRYETLTNTIQEKHKIKVISGYQSVASLPVNDMTYEMLPKFFHYHLETNFFCPKIEWETFVKSYHDYMKHGCSSYIMNDFTDFLFSYVDSGDFSISFNPNLYDKNVIYQEIEKILSE